MRTVRGGPVTNRTGKRKEIFRTVKFLLSITCLLAFAFTALAQSDKRVEFFVGYSNLQVEGVRNFNGSTNNANTGGNFFKRR